MLSCMKPLKKLHILVLFITTLLFVDSSFSQAPTDSQAPANKLIETKAEMVCMVNNKLFRDKQIPVIVDGKTYYGCCEMCKKTLAENEKARTAIDPVSKNKVDKATAIIGTTLNGKVYYFENKENLAKFSL